MARYTGPKHRLARREGVNILDKTSASLLRRLTITPGQHGHKRTRKMSEYGQQLREKQKAKRTYGLLERQFRKLVKSVQSQKGETGELLIGLLETRLDNVVYRLGFANSRPMARQMVTHGHVLVNGKKLNIPSYQVVEEDVISLSPKFQKHQSVLKKVEETENLLVPFLERKGLSGKITRMPKHEDVEVPFSTQPIIEYYSR